MVLLSDCYMLLLVVVRVVGMKNCCFASWGRWEAMERLSL